MLIQTLTRDRQLSSLTVASFTTDQYQGLPTVQQILLGALYMSSSEPGTGAVNQSGSYQLLPDGVKLDGVKVVFL